jgi:hypothetical protein
VQHPLNTIAKQCDLGLVMGQRALTGKMIELTISMRLLCSAVLAVGKWEFEVASANVVDF